MPPPGELDAVPSSRRSLLLQTSAALALAAWRVFERATSGVADDLLQLPADLPFLLSIYWLLDLHVRHPRLRPWLAPAGIFALFAAYAFRHLPIVVEHLRISL